MYGVVELFSTSFSVVTHPSVEETIALSYELLPKASSPTAVSLQNILDRVWDFVSKDAKDLINRMIISPEVIRLDAEEAASHRWIKTYSKATEKPEVLRSVLYNLNKFQVTLSSIVGNIQTSGGGTNVLSDADDG